MAAEKVNETEAAEAADHAGDGRHQRCVRDIVLGQPVLGDENRRAWGARRTLQINMPAHT